MSERYTNKDVETAFRIFCQRAGFRQAESHKDVGAYSLDKGYGGYTVVQIVNENGGLSTPFGMRRRNAREMVQTLHFAADAIDAARKEGQS